MGTTFKYPDEDDLTESYLSGCTAHFNKAEQAMNDTAQIETYIDFTSFARWLLIHDILGSGDIQGSNMYMYIKNFDPEGNSCSTLHMATPWDFDCIFYVGTDELAPIRNSNIFYYPELCQNSDFQSEYSRLWYSLRDSIYSHIEKKLMGFMPQSTAIERSLELMANHALMYPSTPLKTQIAETLALLKARLNTVEQNVRDIPTGITTLHSMPEESSQPIYMRWDGTRLTEEYCKGKPCVRKTGRGGQTIFIVP